jgi:hypothetical protein
MQPIETAPVCSKPSPPRAPAKLALVSLRAFIFAVIAGSACAAGESAANVAALPVPAPTIVQRMVEQNALRAQHLKYFTARRHYHIEFHGLGRTMAADMHAQVTYSAGTGKAFQVIDESGSHLLLNHVLLKLLETEQDDSRQQSAALTPSNYNFTFQSGTTINGRPAFIFAVAPKVKNKLLFRGRVWIDAQDYAVIRVEAQPAENPSFWIKSTEIHHSYAKFGEFWLPQTNESESKVRFGGTAVLTIDYGTYVFQAPRQVTPVRASEFTASAPQLNQK